MERVTLDVGRGAVVPLLVLAPPRKPGAVPPVVVMLAQEGKQAFLKSRAAEVRIRSRFCAAFSLETRILLFQL